MIKYLINGEMILLRYCFLADFIRVFLNSNGAHECYAVRKFFRTCLPARQEY